MVLRSDLALTDAQRMQVRELLVQHRAEIATTVKSVRDCRVELRDTVLRGDADEDTIKSAADKLGAAIAAAAVKAAKLRNNLAPILTDEQQTRARAFQPEVEAQLDQVDKEVSAVLNNEQRTAWQTRFRELRDRWLPALPPALSGPEEPAR
jgi:hypothetical protein